MSRPANALIVDDEAHARTFLRVLLKDLGIENAWEAGDGAQALSLLETYQFDLILLDLNLPILSGVALLAQVRAEAPDTPVIVVTSENALPTVREAARLGAVDYILKQSPTQEIAASLRAAVESLDDELPEGGEAAATS